VVGLSGALVAALHAGMQAEEECQDLDSPDSHREMYRLSLSRMPEGSKKPEDPARTSRCSLLSVCMLSWFFSLE